MQHFHWPLTEELIQYLHQCLFCPPKRTLIKAIKNQQIAILARPNRLSSGEISPGFLPSN